MDFVQCEILARSIARNEAFWMWAIAWVLEGAWPLIYEGRSIPLCIVPSNFVRTEKETPCYFHYRSFRFPLSFSSVSILFFVNLPSATRFGSMSA